MAEEHGLPQHSAAQPQYSKQLVSSLFSLLFGPSEGVCSFDESFQSVLGTLPLYPSAPPVHKAGTKLGTS